MTGASGFLGGALVGELQCRGVETLAVSRRRASRPFREAALVRDYDETPTGDVLVHLAEGRDVGNVPADAVRALTGTLTSLLDKGFAHVVYGSSAVVYGDRNPTPRHPHEEPAPTDPYGSAKLACELIVLEANGIAARLSNVYGPSMSSKNVLSDVLCQIPGDGPLSVRLDSPVRDFLWIEDAVRGLADMALSDGAGVFNLASGIGTSVGDLAQLALDIAGQPERRVVAQERHETTSSIVLDVAATTAAFGWVAETSLEQGLSQLIRGASWPNE